MRTSGILRGVALAAGIGAGLATLSGAVFEKISRERAERAWPARGRVVNLNGHRIQLDCRGAGSPTVVFESGLDTFGSLSWTAVHDSIAATSRACGWSRPGMMWSEQTATSFDVDSSAATLHAVLAAAGETGPYVLVAHSLGGPYITVFTARYPREVAGLVMVDASHPDQFAAYNGIAGKSIMPSATLPRVGAALAWTGLVRVMGRQPVPESWPPLLGEVPPAFLPVSVNALANEAAAIPRTLARAGQVRDLGDRPLIVLTAADPKGQAELSLMKLTAGQGAKLDSVKRELAADMARWSTAGRVVPVTGTGHYVQIERPDAVIGAVREVVAYVIAHDQPPRRR